LLCVCCLADTRSARYDDVGVLARHVVVGFECVE
jgi:hypothetical protein